MKSTSVYYQIVELYKEHGSINKVVELIGGSASKIKVQRVLITEGLWSSKTSREIGDLFRKGKTPQEIADELKISIKNVQSYLPYTKGAYFENETSDSKASREYKQRNRHAARVQVRHVVPAYTEAQKPRMFSPPKKMCRLHLELRCDLNEHEKEILRRFGKVKQTIYRDIAVSPSITLHALHYAIQRAFGWQNSHLHHFSLDPSYECKTVTELTGDTFANWRKLCGRYFRFPVDVNDDEEMVYTSMLGAVNAEIYRSDNTNLRTIVVPIPESYVVGYQSFFVDKGKTYSFRYQSDVIVSQGRISGNTISAYAGCSVEIYFYSINVY